MKGSSRPETRFKARHDRGALAELAARVFDAVLLAEPALHLELITQSLFDRTRSLVEAGIPSAREICRQLECDWAGLKRLAASSAADRERGQLRMRSRRREGSFTRAELISALQLVWARLQREDGATTMAGADYDAKVDELLRADRRRHRHGGRLRLPRQTTVARFAGGWASALALAGIGAEAPRGPRAASISRGEGLDLCFQATGARASFKELLVWVKAQDIRMAAQPWPEALAEFEARLAIRGEKPPAFLPRAKRPDYTEPASAELLKGLPQRTARTFTQSDLLDAVEAYLEQLPAGQVASRQDYGAWAKGHADRPSPPLFHRHGRPFRDYLDVARERRTRSDL